MHGQYRKSGLFKVLTLKRQGLSNKQIAQRFGVTHGTVYYFLRRVGRPTGLQNTPHRVNMECLVWQAIGIGVVAGAPLSLLGEVLLSTARNGPAWLYAVGLLLAAPIATYSAFTENSVFADTATLLTYFILQIVYCTAVIFFLLLLFQHASRRFVAFCAKVKMRCTNKTILALVGGVVFYGFPPQGAHACSIPMDSFFAGDRNTVWVVNGKNRNATVAIRARLDAPGVTRATKICQGQHTIKTIHAVIEHNPETQVSNH